MAAPSIADILSGQSGEVRTAATPAEKVYKDECAYSFDTPESKDGLYICMRTFLGFGRQFVEKYYKRTGNAVFLHYIRIRREIPKNEQEVAEEKKPTRLAIGVEGGFSFGGDKKYDIEEKYSIAVMPGLMEAPLDSPAIPEQIRTSAASIIAADSAAKQAELAAMSGTWDGEARIVSKHAATLQQLNNGRKVAPTGWKCEKCDLRENLWVNLTDGAIMCGRQFWDGSGGNNHAVEHFKETGRPLAVKLGTITPDAADVYSYDEDEMVLDPLLPQHLAHFGIDIMKMEKTDKTMTEMELDLNQRTWEWHAMTECGSQLQPVYGPGYTGIHNIGNSCYMNSVMQVVFTLKPFLDKYSVPAQRIFEENTNDPTGDFNVQMAKFAHGLTSGDYSKPPSSDAPDAAVTPLGIHPHMFKTLIGQGHPEFSTKRQQDAQEFLLHLFTYTERTSRNATNPVDSIRYRVEDRIECGASRKVKYMNHDECCLSLPIPLEAATNKEQVEAYLKKKEALEAQNLVIDAAEVVRPRISLNACLEAFASPAVVDDFYSSAVKARTTANKRIRLCTFPDYLFIHVQKFTVGNDWVERKLDVSLEMPEQLDISHLRGQGKQAGEEELPEEAPPTAAAAPAPAAPSINEEFVRQLVDMGFPVEGCKRAVFNTANAGVEPALNWVMEHMEDANFSDPFVVPQATSAAGGTDQFMADDDSLAMIMSLGFTKTQATKALRATDNNVERAADWIFSHADDMDQSDESVPAAGGQPAAAAAAVQQRPCTDGPGKYRLAAFISHMGTSTKAGHYVCHIRKEGRWVIFNDEKVALSEHPPSDLAYVYLYERI